MLFPSSLLWILGSNPFSSISLFEGLGSVRVCYFAYGSNLDESVLKKRTKTSDSERIPSIPATLDGYRLAFNSPQLLMGPAFASVMTSSRENRVHGSVYEINLNQYAWLLLTEGVPLTYKIQPVELEPYSNYSDSVLVKSNGIRRGSIFKIPAFTLLGTSEGPDRSPSKRYMSIVKKGARKHGLDEDYLNYLEGIDAI